MHQVGAAGSGTVRQVRVHAREHEGRGDNALAHAQAFAQGAGERGLTRTELTREEQYIPGVQVLRQGERQAAGMVGAGHVQVEGGRNVFSAH